MLRTRPPYEYPSEAQCPHLGAQGREEDAIEVDMVREQDEMDRFSSSQLGRVLINRQPNADLDAPAQCPLLGVSPLWAQFQVVYNSCTLH
jgi:hypothetical protein